MINCWDNIVGCPWLGSETYNHFYFSAPLNPHDRSMMTLTYINKLLWLDWVMWRMAMPCMPFGTLFFWRFWDCCEGSVRLCLLFGPPCGRCFLQSRDCRLRRLPLSLVPGRESVVRVMASRSSETAEGPEGLRHPSSSHHSEGLSGSLLFREAGGGGWSADRFVLLHCTVSGGI